jgi:hypothetical protein
MVMSYFFGVLPDATENSLRPHSRRLLRAAVLSLVLAIGCHVWDQYDSRSDQPVTAHIVDCSVVSNVELPLVRILVNQKVYLLRPKAGVLRPGNCRVGDQVKLFYPPDSPTLVRRQRQTILAVPAFLAGLLSFVLFFIAAYLYIWPIWTSGDWRNAPPRLRWLRHVPLQWLSLLWLPLAYPFATWLRS